MLHRWSWPQKGTDQVSPGGRKHSSQTRAGQDSPAACPSHHTADCTGAPAHSSCYIQTVWKWFKTLAFKGTEDWVKVSYVLRMILKNVYLKSPRVMSPLRQTMHCHSRRDWVYWTNWRRLRQESKQRRLRWKYKEMFLYCIFQRIESLFSISLTGKLMLCLYLHWLQLEENSKLWGRQKQEMLTKLSERRHGFVRTSTRILHNIPPVSWVQLAFCFA